MKKKRTDFYDSHHLRYCDESFIDKRFLPLKSSFNMRDIGGYTNQDGKPIKWNKIYRGEELCHLNEEDYIEFNKLGITHVFDFRDTWATEYKPDRLPEGANYINLPVLENLDYGYMDPATTILTDDRVKSFMESMYLAQAKHRAHEFSKVLKVLRDDPNAVIYIHCTNGKDRTGFMTALIMLLAGIEEEKIISEYTLSNHNFTKAYRTLSAKYQQGLPEEEDDEREFYGVDPDWLQVQLDYIKNNYDTIDSYLIENTDLSQEDLETIRNNIIERM